MSSFTQAGGEEVFVYPVMSVRLVSIAALVASGRKNEFVPGRVQLTPQTPKEVEKVVQAASGLSIPALSPHYLVPFHSQASEVAGMSPPL